MDIFKLIKEKIQENVLDHRNISKGIILGGLAGLGAVLLNRTMEKTVENKKFELSDNSVLNDCFYIMKDSSLFENLKILDYYINNFLSRDFYTLVKYIELFLSFTNNVRQTAIKPQNIPKAMAINENYFKKIDSFLNNIVEKMTKIITTYEIYMDISINNKGMIDKEKKAYILKCYEYNINNISLFHLKELIDNLINYNKGLFNSNRNYLKMK